MAEEKRENPSTILFEEDVVKQGRRARKSASRAARYMSKHSNIVKSESERLVPRFDESEIVLGKILGSGGFNNVYELERIELLYDPLNSKHYKKISTEIQTQLRRDAAQKYQETSNFAIKCLSQKTINDSDRFCTGAADLVVEAKFLASLSHPNIISLRGMAAAGTSGFASCRPNGYFLVLDRLQCSLEDVINDWKEEEKKATGSLQRKILDRNGRKQRNLLADRLRVAFDIASALLYLHQNKIIYRDLKPDNVGFDCNGIVKLFDFGLAKELDDTMRLGYCSEFYQLSGNTGSLRYMAPEVALSQPYNLTADVYSFGLLLWQMSSLELPYDGMSRADHSLYVVKGKQRPELNPSWSTPLRILMKRAWESDPSVRPSMDSTYKILKREVISLRNPESVSLETVRRQSSYRIGWRGSSHKNLNPDKGKSLKNIFKRQYSTNRVNLIGVSNLSDRNPIERNPVAA
mmetsp:Transcript_7833/g.8998  ORF Transcript_7833/g.8998 Transcript_7833/m.8998 type:complete len:463 (-) Transcript_7833:15-1403(-)